MNIEGFSRLVKEMYSVNTLEALEEICYGFTVLSNMDYYLLTILERTSLYSPTLKLHSNFPSTSLANIKKNTACSNLFISCQADKHAPEHWNNETANIPDTSNKFAAFMYSYNISCGMSIPIKSTSGELVFFNMLSEEEMDPAHMDSTLLFAHTFAAHLIDNYLRINKELISANKLSKRENDCLFWACEGKTAWEISQIIGLSQRTVTFHLMNITNKLRANNRQHAVALAIMKGIIKPNFEGIKSYI